MTLTAEQLAEVTKAAEENRARQEALEQKRRNERGEALLVFVRAADDPNLLSEPMQSEFRSVSEALKVRDVAASPIWRAQDAVEAPSGYIGQYIIPIAQAIGPTLGVIVTAWLHGRAGRKVRLKVGDIEAEAQTVEEVERLFDLVDRYREGRTSDRNDELDL